MWCHVIWFGLVSGRPRRGHYPDAPVSMLRYLPAAPKGPQHNSPGQRPGDLIRVRISPSPERAEQGFHSHAYRALSGRFSSSNAVPRAMPWADLSGPFRARTEMRNIKTRQRGAQSVVAGKFAANDSRIQLKRQRIVSPWNAAIIAPIVSEPADLIQEKSVHSSSHSDSRIAFNDRLAFD